MDGFIVQFHQGLWRKENAQMNEAIKTLKQLGSPCFAWLSTRFKVSTWGSLKAFVAALCLSLHKAMYISVRRLLKRWKPKLSCGFYYV